MARTVSADHQRLASHRHLLQVRCWRSPLSTTLFHSGRFLFPLGAADWVSTCRDPPPLQYLHRTGSGKVRASSKSRKNPPTPSLHVQLASHKRPYSGPIMNGSRGSMVCHWCRIRATYHHCLVFQESLLGLDLGSRAGFIAESHSLTPA